MPEERDEGVDYSSKNEALYFPNNGRQQNFKFDYQKAVAHARQYNMDKDDAYSFDNDCTSFVSFCWSAAGIPEDYGHDGWYCTSTEKEDYTHSSYAWRYVSGFCIYMRTQGYIDVVNREDLFWKYACLGDVIQLGGEYGDNWHHSLIITDIIGPDIRVTGHSDKYVTRVRDRHDQEEEVYRDGTYSLALRAKEKKSNACSI